MLRILTGKKHHQMKLQRLQKVQIWAFGLSVQQINSLQEVLKLKQNFQKNKVRVHFVVTILCLNIGF